MTDRAPPSVLFILPWHPDVLGGVNTCVVNLYRKLESSTGFRAVLLYDSYPAPRIAERCSDALGTVYQFHIPPPFDPAAPVKSVLSYLARLPGCLLRLRRFLRRENVQVVNLHFPTMAAATILLVRALVHRHCRVVLSFHGADLPPILAARGLQRLIWRGIFSGADAAAACSRSLAAMPLGEYPMLAAKMHAIHNGVDVADCEAAVRGTRRPAELPEQPYIVAVGKFEAKKAHDLMLASFRSLLSEHPTLNLVLVGTSGPTLPAIRQQAADPVFAGRVTVIADLPHAATIAVIAGARLLVLPSRTEPFGIVLIEAGALETPVIAAEVGGVPEIVEHAHTGLLFPSGDVAALTAAISRLLANQAMACAHARNFKRVVATDFTWDRALRAYERLFRAPTE